MGKTNVLLKDKMRILLGKSVDVTELLQDYFRLAVKMKKKQLKEHGWFFQSPDTQVWQNDYLQGTGCEMYTETLSPSFTGMTFPQASE